MTVQKKTIRTDIPGHHLLLSGGASKSSVLEAEQSRLIVGRSITLRGDISACNHLVVEGIVEVQGLTTNKMDILDSGVFYGTAVAQDVVISGRFEGQLTVHGRLVIKSTGSIVGQVSYGSIEMENGAAVDAHMAILPQVHLQASNDVDAPVDMNMDVTVEDGETADTEGSEGRASLFKRVVGY